MPQRYANSRRTTFGAGRTCLVLLGIAAAAARADDLLGPYAGAAFGKATLDAATGLVSGFGSDKSAYQLIVGLRPVPAVAAELEYLDFGHASGLSTYSNSNVTLSSEASRKGVAAFGVLYLPTPIVDFYVKAGLARLHTRAATTVVGCATGGVCPPLAQPAPVDSTDGGIAGGAGVMYRIASLELRGEYQRFSALGGNPWLLTFGGTWTF